MSNDRIFSHSMKRKTKKISKESAKQLLTDDNNCTDEETQLLMKTFKSANGNKKKFDEMCEESITSNKKKLQTYMDKRTEIRKKDNGRLVRSLALVVGQLQEDCGAMEQHVQKMEHFCQVQIKNTQKSIVCLKQRLLALTEIQTGWNKMIDEVEEKEQQELAVLAEELAESTRRTQQRLLAEGQRTRIDKLRKTVMSALQADMDF